MSLTCHNVLQDLPRVNGSELFYVFFIRQSRSESHETTRLLLPCFFTPSPNYAPFHLYPRPSLPSPITLIAPLLTLDEVQLCQEFEFFGDIQLEVSEGWVCIQSEMLEILDCFAQPGGANDRKAALKD